MRRLLLVLCALCLALTACGTSAPQYDLGALTTAVEQATGVSGITVSVEKVEGDYMRARATPPAELNTDEAIVFLKREAGAWMVLNYGTAFSPEDYARDNIPEALWLGN